MKKSERLAVSYRNAIYTESVLFRRPRFEKAVKIFRTKWNIPPNGLTKSQLLGWREWFASQSARYKPTDEDLELELMRQKRELSYSYILLEGFEKLLNRESITLEIQQAFQNNIGEILIKNHLNPRWFRYVEHYLMLNEKVKVPSGMEYNIQVDEHSGQEIIILKITDEVGKADFLAVWNMIKEHQNQLPYKTKLINQPIRNWKRYCDVYDMFIVAKKSIDEVKEYLDKYHPKKPIPGDTPPYIHTDNDIYKDVDEYRKIVEES